MHPMDTGVATPCQVAVRSLPLCVGGSRALVGETPRGVIRDDGEHDSGGRTCASSRTSS